MVIDEFQIQFRSRQNTKFFIKPITRARTVDFQKMLKIELMKL